MGKIFWLLAVTLSLFWGIYGLNYVKKEEEEKEEAKKGKIEPKKFREYWKDDKIEAGGILLSEFIGSLAGWYCFSLLAPRLKDIGNLGGFDIFLGIVAIICIPGYSYKLVDALEKRLKI